MERTRIDIGLLFATRIVRLFAYGFVSVVLVLYLTAAGLGTPQVGLLLTLTLAGDAVISLWLTTTADRFGRRRTLIIGAALMLGAGAAFVMTQNPVLLTLAAIVGVISPSGNEIGPFLSIEQAALSQLVPDDRRTHVFAWYNLAGSFATATGALCAGVLAQTLQDSGWTALDSYRAILAGYALIGVLLLAAFGGSRLRWSLPAEGGTAAQAVSRSAQIANDCAQTQCAVCAGRVCWRLRSAEHRCLLV